jgi:REP element-mobilizing transposase RayT
MDRKIKKTPPRLENIFQKYDPPLYFVTFNTLHRRPLLARQEILDRFLEYAHKNEQMGRAIGRFVIMPDHIHLFVRIGHESRLSDFIRLLKQALTKALRNPGVEGTVWQPGFFDRLLRYSESYYEKWNYVRENPVRAGLVMNPDDWPWQGEVVLIDRV